MSGRKRKKKSYYVQAKKTCSGRQQLEADQRGFLITCSNKLEKQAVREAYNVLNEYADNLYGEEVKDSSSITTEAAEMDFAAAIAQQMDACKSNGREGLRRFQAVETKTSNCVFIRTTLEHPDDLLSKYLSDVAINGITKSRFILKIFPVLGTCRSTEEKIEKLLTEVLTTKFSNVSLGSYATQYKVRCNNLGREHILPLVGRIVQQTCPGSRVDLSNPDIVISIDILGKFCCISVMRDFYKLKKYNVQELGKTQELNTEVHELGKETQELGKEAQELGKEAQELGKEAQELGKEVQELGKEAQELISKTEELSKTSTGV